MAASDKRRDTQRLADRELRILLIGKTGHGKSSTGNSILGEKLFEESNGSTSCTKEVLTQEKNHVRVTDTPGLFDTEISSSTLSHDHIRRMLLKCLMTTIPGLDAILFVIRHGERFTSEMQKTQQLFFDWFGPGVEKYAYLLITHCKSNDEAKQYIAENPHEFLQDLAQKCANRILSVDNHGVNVKLQVRDIIQEIRFGKARNNGTPYTDVKYQTIEHIAKTRDPKEVTYESLDIMTAANQDVRRFLESEGIALITDGATSDQLSSYQVRKEPIRIYYVSASDPDKFERAPAGTDKGCLMFQRPAGDHYKGNEGNPVSHCSDEERELSSSSEEENPKKSLSSATDGPRSSNKPVADDDSTDNSWGHSSDEEQNVINTSSDEVKCKENHEVGKVSTEATFCKKKEENNVFSKTESRKSDMNSVGYKGDDIQDSSDYISKEEIYSEKETIQHGLAERYPGENAERNTSKSFKNADDDKVQDFRKKMDEDHETFLMFYKKLIRWLRTRLVKLPCSIS